MFLNCQKAGVYIEKSNHLQLGYFSKVRLGVHIAICDGCKRYAVQSKLLDNALKNTLTANNVEGLKLSPGAKSRMEKAIKNH